MNKRFYYITLKLLLIGLLVFSLLGCKRGNSDGNLQEADQQAAMDSVVHLTLAVRTYSDDLTLNNLISQFNSSHPDTEVELLNMPKDQYDNFLNMRMTSGEGPDLFQIGTGWLTTYIYKNWLLDLSEVVDVAFTKDFPEWAVNYTKNNQHYYVIPSDTMTLRLIYNKDLLKYAGLDPEAPPETLQELREAANQITIAGTGYRKYGFALPAGEDETFQKALEISSTYSGLYYYNFATGKYDFNVYLPWFNTMLAMKKEGGLFPGETSLQSDTALTQFAEGNIGMMLVSNHDYAILSRMKPLPFAWGIAMPPLSERTDQGKGKLMEFPEPPFAINAYSPHKQEAVELWKYLLSSEVLGELYKQGNAIPTLEGVTDEPQYQTALPKFSDFLPNAEESPYPREPKFILQNTPSPFDAKNVGDTARMKAYREILQGIHTPAEVLHNLTVQYNNSLNDAVAKQLISLPNFVNPSFDPRNPLKETR